MRRYSPKECAAVKVLTGEIDTLLRTVPTALHGILLQQFLYGIIVRRGAWSPQTPPEAPRPWQYRRPRLA
jgi:DNA polymerase-3 subunit delta